MTDAEYFTTLDHVGTAGLTLVGLGDRLETARDAVATLQALGPIVDPLFDGWRSARVAEQKALIDAAVAFRDACKVVAAQAAKS